MQIPTEIVVVVIPAIVTIIVTQIANRANRPGVQAEANSDNANAIKTLTDNALNFQAVYDKMFQQALSRDENIAKLNSRVLELEAYQRTAEAELKYEREARQAAEKERDTLKEEVARLREEVKELPELRRQIEQLQQQLAALTTPAPPVPITFQHGL